MIYIFGITFILLGSLFIISIINAWTRTSELRRSARFGTEKLLHVRRSRVHYVEFGDGPCLIMLPSLFESYRTWNPVLPALSSHFRCICVNYFGYGDSDIPNDFNYELAEMSEFIIDMLDRLHIEIAHFLGVGFGASIVLDLAARFPLCVNRSVAIEGVVDFKNNIAIPELMRYKMFSIPVVGAINHLVFRSGLFGKSIARNILGAAWDEMSNIERQNFLNDFSISMFESKRSVVRNLASSWIQNKDLVQDAHKIEVPVLYLMGDESEFQQVLEPTNAILKQLPSVTRWRIQDGIHQLHWQYPRWVGQVVTHFLKEEDVFSRPDSGGLWEIKVT